MLRWDQDRREGTNPIRTALRFVALGLCVSFVGTGITTTSAHAAPTKGWSAASSQNSYFAQRVKVLVSLHPYGGDAFVARLTNLIAMQSDGAAAVATLMVTLGDLASPSLLAAVGQAIEAAKPVSAAELASAIEAAILASPNPAAAARSIMSGSITLPASVQASLSEGLSAASSQLVATGRADQAAVISIEIATAPGNSVAQSYKSTIAINPDAKDPNDVGNIDYTPLQPVSPS